MRMSKSPIRNYIAAASAGVIGGLIGAFAMDRFQTKALPKISRNLPSEPQEPATVIAAEKLVEQVGGKIPDRKKNLAGNLVHYTFGAMTGLAYGLLARLAPKTRIGAGLPFGVAVFLLADEGVVPALGLSKSPRAYPFRVHLNAFASHLVFGLTLYLFERTARSAFQRPAFAMARR